MLRKLPLLAGALLTALAIWADPYSFHVDGSDFLAPAPAWQVCLTLADLALLGWFASSVWRGRMRLAFGCLAGALLVNLAANLIYVLRDDFSRFIMGFGAEHVLWRYLAFLIFRVLLLAATGLMISSFPQATRR